MNYKVRDTEMNDKILTLEKNVQPNILVLEVNGSRKSAQEF